MRKVDEETINRLTQAVEQAKAQKEKATEKYRYAVAKLDEAKLLHDAQCWRDLKAAEAMAKSEEEDPIITEAEY